MIFLFILLHPALKRLHPVLKPKPLLTNHP
jgi:hypothetical protein